MVAESWRPINRPLAHGASSSQAPCVTQAAAAAKVFIAAEENQYLKIRTLVGAMAAVQGLAKPGSEKAHVCTKVKDQIIEKNLIVPKGLHTLLMKAVAGQTRS